MHRLSSAFVLGYHGCSSDVAESVLSGAPFRLSDNDYDWLGPGVYFWQSNPKRALQFAEEKRNRDGASWRPAVVGAVVDLGLCLDLTTDTGVEEVRAARAGFDLMRAASKLPIPVNKPSLPRLDCAVIRTLHQIRADGKILAVNTVLGVFIEGQPIYPTSIFFEKTHIQICVRNSFQIKGVFRVPAIELTT